ncbi:Cro/CI family transcriptional regulator [Psychromonas arctica]|uniref:Cro/CI family transcriptional regulator n=1 Tax=Psychromonas arctica TaxID=168275 RepID=UPI002FD738E7
MKKAVAIKFFGSGANLAKALKINSSAVYQWPEVIPRLRAFEIERLTKGKLKAD